MKKNLQLILMIVLMATSGLMYSCKDDEMESITLKRSGNLKVSIKNGETPIANTQIRFANADTENELDVVTTDAQGVVDFGKLNEGNYSISFEMSNPYAFITQEFQVVSGESKEYTVQVADYTGTLNVFLKDNNSGIPIREDLKVGVAVVPMGDDFQKAFTNEEILALAIDKKYFGTEGKLMFDKIPTGYYRLYKILADTIVASDGSTYVNRLDEGYYSMYVNTNIERLYNKNWTFNSAVSYDTDEAISDFPVESMTFSRSTGVFTMNLADGIIVKGTVSYSGGSYIDMYNLETNNENIYVNFSEDGIQFDENGQLILDFYYFRMGEGGSSSNIFDQYYIFATFN